MNRPKLSRQDIEGILAAKSVKDPVALVGIRGYYLDSMGRPGVNDRGIYDDAIFLITPTKLFSFPANTDPSVFRPGIATMQPGVHRYRKGKHKARYWALRLVGETVPVTRDGQTGTKTGVALNIHKGGFRTTGSEGCQTIYPQFWDEFIELVYDAMDGAGMKTIPYVLVNEVERRHAPAPADPPETLPVKTRADRELPAASGPQTVPAPPLQADAAPVADADGAEQAPAPTGTGWTGTLSGYAQGFDQIDQFASKVSNSSWLVTLLAKAAGYGLLAWSVLKENWVESVVALVLIVAAIWFLTRSKDRGIKRAQLLRGNNG